MDTPTPQHSTIKSPILLNLVQINSKWLPHISCKVCSGLFRLPIVVCGKCKNLACSICIEEKLKIFGKCPLQESCSNFDDYPYFSNPLIDPLFEDLRISCPASKNPVPADQCKSVLKYSEYGDHIEHCQLILQKCKYPNCNAQVPKKNMADHEKNCDFLPTACTYCQKSFYKSEIPQHSDTCPDKVKCSYCLKFVSKYQYQDHLLSCEFVEVECSGCLEKMVRQQLAKHQSECTQVPQVCHICGQQMSKSSLKEHRIEHCIINQMKNMQQQFHEMKVYFTEEMNSIKKEIQSQNKIQQESNSTLNEKIQCLEDIYKEGIQINQSRIDKVENSLVSRLDQLVKDQLTERKREIEQAQKKLQQIEDELKDLRPAILKEANQNCGYKEGVTFNLR